MRLSQADKDRCFYHLGYMGKPNVKQQDLKNLERALNRIRDSYSYEKILEQLDRCDLAREQIDIVNESSTSKTFYTGDLNRTTVKFELTESMRGWQKFYEFECNQLTELLYVTNLNSDGLIETRFNTTGLEVRSEGFTHDIINISILESLIDISGGTGF